MQPAPVLTPGGRELYGIDEARIPDLTATHCRRPRLHPAAGTPPQASSVRSGHGPGHERTADDVKHRRPGARD